MEKVLALPIPAEALPPAPRTVAQLLRSRRLAIAAAFAVYALLIALGVVLVLKGVI
jgi:hypothetical protein